MAINTIHSALSQFLMSYKEWMIKNPHLLKDIESIMKCLSYITAGRFNDSSLASELIYSIPNLLVLFNDILMYSGKCVHLNLPQFESKIKIWLTVLEYTDVLFEVSAKKILGETGRWLIIVFVQMLKSVMRLLLVYLYNERVTKSLPIAPLNREKLNETSEDDILSKQGFVLKRSGTVVRSIKASEPIQMRVWAPPVPTTDKNMNYTPTSKKDLILAETLYIVKPLIHLGCTSFTGQKKWQPWFLSLAIDIISLKLIGNNAKHTTFSKEENEEILRRKVGLLLYILRSPFYDKYSRAKIYALLNSISTSVPFARLLVEPIQKYLPHWQNSYFYTWSC